MASPFRDDGENLGVLLARRCTALLALMLLLSPALAMASGIPPVVPGNRDLSAVTELVTAGQFRAADARIDAALKQPELSPDARRALEFQRERMQRVLARAAMTAQSGALAQLFASMAAAGSQRLAPGGFA
jgi:hypothetical protein